MTTAPTLASGCRRRAASACRSVVCVIACALATGAVHAAPDDTVEPPTPPPGMSRPAVDGVFGFRTDMEARRRRRVATGLTQEDGTPALRFDWNTKAGALADIESNKSYWIPAAEIIGFDLLLNGINRHYIGNEYNSSLSSIRRNLRSGWRVDNDPFATNQFGHPYQGSMYHGFARSAGLGFWASLGYTEVGSALWEIAGETTPPSLNDQITTGFGGSLLGEALFRMSSLILEKSELPRFWRELGAAAISPATGFNRLAFGNRFDTLFPSGDPVYYGRLAVGISTVTHNESSLSFSDLKNTEALADFSLDYGLPGKPGYTYDRPFDLFAFKITASSVSGLENVMTRGLLAGRAYEAGGSYRGVWGLYGSYDYIEPQTFRVSSTALSLGTTGQWWMSDAVALQGSVLAGLGYATVGSVRSSGATDNHYGTAPQALVALRFIFGDRASLETTTRGYFVSRAGGVNPNGARDHVYRLDAALTMRVARQHAMSLRYLYSRRDTISPSFADRSQSSGTIGVFYTYLGSESLGAVEWRDVGEK
jgi:hypothetical protein